MEFYNSFKRVGFVAMIILSSSLKIVAQQDNSSRSNNGSPQSNDSTISTFLHVKPESGRSAYYQPKAFVLKYHSADYDWKSDSIAPITRDSLGYLVKVRIPAKILATHPMFNCKPVFATGVNPRADTASYGVDLNPIKLFLISTPKRAEVYLIPNRLWIFSLKNARWQQDNTLISKYIVDSDKTDVWVGIDQTVYVVIFKLDNKYLVRTHYTKPAETDPVQKVTVDF